MLFEFLTRNRKQTVFTSLLVGVTLLSVGSLQVAAAAETRWYDVEVIIFSHNSQQYRNSELWPVDYELPAMGVTQALLPARPGNKPVAFSQLDSNSLRLKSHANRIKTAKDMELLLHMGWRQPGLPEDKAIAIQVDEGPSQRLSGTLKLVLSRFLHINTDLIYREQRSGDNSSDLSTQPRYQAYNLKQSRRMRSRELHYLDHPLFGMAIMVTPYQGR